MQDLNYEEFLKTKIIETTESGFDVDDGWLNSKMFNWQEACVRFLLKKGKAAIFADCGLGKTLMQLEWARQVCLYTGGKVLIVAPLAVSKQTKEEGSKFGYDVHICRCQKDVVPGITINITNYEMLEHFNFDEFAGVVLDESSILKSYMGKTKQYILNAFKNTPYKLSATATPSPNDHMEILNQAEFLGVMRASEALAIWFINDSTSSGNYRLKGHSVKDFWKWVSSWAICMSKPSDIGYSDEGFILPKLIEKDVVVDVDISDIENGKLIRDIDTSATGFHKEKRLTAEDRAKKCAEIVNSTNEQYVIWCNTDYEADYLKKYIGEAVEVRGSDKAEHKEQSAIDFKSGKIRVLISKPKIFGYGLNFQNCHKCIFCGMDYSYENYYQAVRRFWRFGQKSDVIIYRVIGETEKHILEVVAKKQRLQNEMHDNMYNAVRNIQTDSLNGHKFTLRLSDKKITLPEWLKGT